MNNTIAIYPGTFDPITNGHLDIIDRASAIFNKVIVAVATNPQKVPLFTDEERLDMIRRVVEHLPGVETDCIQGLLVNYAQKMNRGVILLLLIYENNCR